MKRLALLVTASFITMYGISQDLPKMAPLNPDYINYLKQKTSGKIKSQTYNGHGLGEIPSPVVLNFGNVSKSNISKSIPASYDLRTENGGNWISPVRDQGSEGACWAFATYGAVESYWLKQGKGQYDLSEQNLATCHGFDWSPSDGGNYYLSTAYLSRHSGPVSESDDPYTLPSNPGCVSGLTPINFVQNARFLPGSDDSGYDADIIKQAIIDNGAIYVNLYWDGAYFNGTDFTYFYNGSDNTNHAVLLTGWDDNKVVTGGSATPSGNGAWIIRNSWGPSWGDNGFFYVSYEDTKALSLVAYFPSYIDYNSNIEPYFYDKLGMTMSIGYSDGTDYGLIKYTATKDMEIQKIGTYVNTAGSNIEVEIFDDFDGSSLSSSLGSINNQICDYPGYYTFNLSSAISITSGNDFYIRVKYNTPGYNYPIPCENRQTDFSNNATIETGKCWISSNGTSSWVAFGTETEHKYDLCIKAYTLFYSNNPPVLSSVTNQATDEDTPITLDISMVTASDVEGDSLNIVVLSGNNYSVTDSTVTPDENWNGDLMVPIKVSDGADSSNTVNMTITVTAVNDPGNDAPLLFSVTDKTTDEDTPITLDISMLTASDDDGDALYIGVIDGEHYSVTDSTVTPDADFNGELTVPVFITDQTISSDTLDMIITVSPVNDAPVLSSVTNQATDEDTPITLDISMVTITDVDGDSLNIVVLDGNNYLVTDSTVTPDENWNGDLTVPVYVTDQTENSNTLDMTITVNPVNDAPVLSNVTNQTTDEDIPITLDITMVTVSDVEGDSLNIVVLDGDNYSVTDSTVTPDEDWNGDLTVPIKVSDGIITSDTVNMIITVTAIDDPGNDAPILYSVTDQITDENTAITLDISMVTASDDDGDALYIGVVDGEHYSVTDSTVTPDENWNGDLIVPVYVTDQITNSDILNMIITVDPDSHAPVLSSVTNQATDEDTPITLKMSMVTASDVDGDNLSIVPVANMLFSDNFKTNLLGTKWFTRDIYMPGGSSPELAFIKDTLGATGVLFVPGGKRGDEANYNGNISRLADTIAVSGGDYEIEARLYWTGNNTTWGSYGVQAIVFREQSNNLENFAQNCYKFQWDGNSSGEWSLERNVNSSWTHLEATSSNPIREDQWYKMKVIADSSDIQCLVNYEDGEGWIEIFSRDISGDGDKFYDGYAGLFFVWNYEPEAQAIDYYEVRSLDNSINTENYSVTDSTIIPDADFNGDLTVPVYVTDQVENSDTLDMIITVNPVNDAPALSSVTDQTTDEDTPITLDMNMVITSDIDGDSLTIVVLNGDNYSVTDSTVTPDENWNGDLTVPVYVTDQTLNSDTIDMTITVNPVNDAPVLSSVTNQATDEDTPITLKMSMVTASDVDGDNLIIVPLVKTLFNDNFNTDLLGTKWFTRDIYMPGGSSPEMASIKDTLGATGVLFAPGGRGNEDYNGSVLRLADPDAVSGGDYEIEARLYWTGNNTTWGSYGVQAIVFREQSNNPESFTLNCYKFQWDGNGSGEWSLERRVNGSWTHLNASSSNPIREDQWYKMKVIADSSDIQCLVNYEDGEGWIEIFSRDISGDGDKFYDGYAGLFFNWNYEPEAQAIDYFEVRSLNNSINTENYSVTDSTIIPDADFNGDLTVPVYVTDQVENSDTLDMIITVNPVNDAPALSSVTDQTTNKNTPITLDISMVTASDAEGDDLNIVVLTGSNYSVTDSTVTPELDFAGDLTVPVKVTDGVDSSNTVNMTINVSSTGFDDINNSSISIYPNPVKNIINVNYDKEFSMEIYNVLGKKIIISKHAKTNVSNLPTGIYIIIIKDKENKLIKFKKVVKQ